MTFAAHQFKLNARQSDGATLREHLEVASARRIHHPLLTDQPELPAELEELWREFTDLHSSRGAGLAGPLPITFADIDVYQRVTGTPLKQWEIEAIRRADRAFFESCAEAKDGN